MTAVAPGIELTNPAGYQATLLALLGDRDPLAVMRETPAIIAAILRAAPLDRLRRRPYPDRWTWTPLEIVGHLCDAEIVFAFRIRLILSEDRPTITPMDQDKWVAAQKYNERDPAELLAGFRALREINVRLWEQMRPTDLERMGLHAERGPETLGLMRKMEAGHDLSHLGQLQKYLQAMH